MPEIPASSGKVGELGSQPSFVVVSPQELGAKKASTPLFQATPILP
jgi:hypothetical protein